MAVITTEKLTGDDLIIIFGVLFGVMIVFLFIALCIKGTQQAKKENAPLLHVYAKAIEKATVPGVGISAPRTRVMFELENGRRIQLFVPDHILIAVGDVGQLEYQLDTVEQFRPSATTAHSTQQTGHTAASAANGGIPTWKRIELERQRAAEQDKCPNCGAPRKITDCTCSHCGETF